MVCSLCGENTQGLPAGVTAEARKVCAKCELNFCDICTIGSAEPPAQILYNCCQIAAIAEINKDPVLFEQIEAVFSETSRMITASMPLARPPPRPPNSCIFCFGTEATESLPAFRAMHTHPFTPARPPWAAEKKQMCVEGGCPLTKHGRFAPMLSFTLEMLFLHLYGRQAKLFSLELKQRAALNLHSLIIKMQAAQYTPDWNRLANMAAGPIHI